VRLNMSISIIISIVGIGIALMVGISTVFYMMNTLPLTSSDSETNTSMENVKTIIYVSFGIASIGLVILAAFSILPIIMG
jgi:hypothetical protein